MTDPSLAPYMPTLTLILGAAAVVGATRWLLGWFREDTKREIAAERDKVIAALGAEIMAERNETRSMIGEAIRQHAEADSARHDVLSEQLAGYHRECLQAISDTKNMATRVAEQYQHMRRETAQYAARLAALEAQPTNGRHR